MRFYKVVKNGYIVVTGTGLGNTEITEEKYNEILNLIHNRPTAPEGYVYRLTDGLEWELCEVPVIEGTDPELTEAEALNILLGGDAE